MKIRSQLHSSLFNPTCYNTASNGLGLHSDNFLPKGNILWVRHPGENVVLRSGAFPKNTRHPDTFVRVSILSDSGRKQLLGGTRQLQSPLYH